MAVEELSQAEDDDRLVDRVVGDYRPVQEGDHRVGELVVLLAEFSSASIAHHRRSI